MGFITSIISLLQTAVTTRKGNKQLVNILQAYTISSA